MLLVIGNEFLIPLGNIEFEFQRMKVFSGLQLENDVDYSSIQNCVSAVTLFRLEKAPLSLLDKCKRMTEVHPHFPTILKTNQQRTRMI